MSAPAPTIRAVVHHQGGTATDVTVQVRELPDVQALLVGAPAPLALDRVVAVHGVCARAHAAAGRAALVAIGVQVPPILRTEVVDEAKREAVLTLVREPSRLLGGEVDARHVVGMLRGDAPETALIGLVGADPERLAADPAALDAWMAAGATPLARLIAGTAALVADDPVPIGPLRRQADCPGVQNALERGRAGLARWLARLVDLQRLLRGEPGDVGVVHASLVDPRHATSRVETSRGALIHDVELDDDGNVVSWSIDRPTFRFLTSEALSPAAVGRPLVDAVQAVELLVASLDPCFSWQVDVEEA